MPSLVSTLLNREQAKGNPLTEAEVIDIRDNSPRPPSQLTSPKIFYADRGYKDIDPEECWEQWQEARKSLI